MVMASSISLMRMYSSAVWEREDSPGPIFTDGKRIRAWSERVGEPNGTSPDCWHRCTNGWSTGMRDELRRKDRATGVLCILRSILVKISSLV